MSGDELNNIKSTIMVDSRQSSLYAQDEYIIKKPCQTITTQKFQPNSKSSNSLVYQIQLPSRSILCDRKVVLAMSVTQNFTGTTEGAGNLLKRYGAPDAGGYTTFEANFGLRQDPLGSICENLSVYINGANVSCQLNNFNSLLAYTYTPEQLKTSLSGSAMLADSNQLVAQMGGNVRNPLANYGVSFYSNRGSDGVSYYINPATYSTTNADVTAYFYSYLECSPFTWHETQNDLGGLAGISLLQITYSLANAQNMWMVDVLSPALQPLVGGTIATGQTVFNQALAYMTFLTATPIMGPLSDNLRYNVCEFNTFTKDAMSPVAYQISDTINSDTVALPCIPSKMIIAVQRRKADRSPYVTDSLAPITNINILFNNNDGILSGADPYQLYLISSRNGSNQTWSQFCGAKVDGTVGYPQGYQGSCIILDFAKDISGLLALDAIGTSGSYNLRVTASYINPTPTTYGTDPDIVNVPVPTYSLNITLLYDAMLTISPTFTSLANGFDRSKVLQRINSGDIDVNAVDFAMYNVHAFGSGSWWSNFTDKLKIGLRKIQPFIAPATKLFNQFVQPFVPGAVGTAVNIGSNILQDLLPSLVGQGLSHRKIVDILHRMPNMPPIGELEQIVHSHMRGGALIGGELVGGRRIPKRRLAKY